MCELDPSWTPFRDALSLTSVVPSAPPKVAAEFARREFVGNADTVFAPPATANTLQSGELEHNFQTKCEVCNRNPGLFLRHTANWMARTQLPNLMRSLQPKSRLLRHRYSEVRSFHKRIGQGMLSLWTIV